MQVDSITSPKRVYLVDDLLATGGTAKAAAELLNKSFNKLVGIGFVIELTNLDGRKKLPSNVPIDSLIKYY